MRLSRLLFAWLAVLLLGAVVQFPSASGAAAHAAHQPAVPACPDIGRFG